MIPYGKQYIDESDINAVVEVLKADFLTQGPAVPRFEELVSNFVNCKYICTYTETTRIKFSNSKTDGQYSNVKTTNSKCAIIKFQYHSLINVK